ncbi:hypothetical protein CYMTET_51778 [Cymbomonas tetramitiformis]|uniref:UBX domain-containing protein n=1 Tax=Cymbomonas tetramitiformis TaxID=36881 RepID=A0AAE0ESB1_9CHLO|nr:hypothetical protein CYMTET_51778 [Cymbomonas tetramitiformis]
MARLQVQAAEAAGEEQTLKAETSSRRAKIEESKQLTTRAYKEKLAAAKRSVHSTATVRIRLPDGVILQGCFGAREQVSELFHFVTDALRLPLPFELFAAAAKVPLADTEAGRPRTFASASLAPSTLLYLKWSDKNDQEPVPVLRQELMQNAQSLIG